jgi:hypothetical protein
LPQHRDELRLKTWLGGVTAWTKRSTNQNPVPQRPPSKAILSSDKPEQKGPASETVWRNDFDELTFLASEILSTSHDVSMALSRTSPAPQRGSRYRYGLLELTRQAYPYSETQVWAADAILAAWRSGVRHKIRLANYAIGAFESKKRLNGREILSFNPRAS